MYFISIDISSTSTKVTILDNQDNFCDLFFLLSSSFSAIKIVRDIKEFLEQKSYQYASIVATEYGRASVEADVVVFENCTGTKKFKNNISTHGDLVENIAKCYLKTPHLL